MVHLTPHLPRLVVPLPLTPNPPPPSPSPPPTPPCGPSALLTRLATTKFSTPSAPVATKYTATRLVTLINIHQIFKYPNIKYPNFQISIKNIKSNTKKKISNTKSNFQISKYQISKFSNIHLIFNSLGPSGNKMHGNKVSNVDKYPSNFQISKYPNFQISIKNIKSNIKYQKKKYQIPNQIFKYPPNFQLPRPQWQQNTRQQGQ